ncbi:MAG TPA: hypothetical protein VGP94_15235, partial [Tepidisphaeraceae bacterium]|nr:hypothetical protein [Tepidisphaeraceae bacterium]
SLLAAAALYTQPLAILLVAAHGLTILLIRRELFITWFRSALLTGLLTFLLYFPFLHGARHYWTKPEQPSGPYTQFILSSLRYAHFGGDRGGALPIIVSLIIIIAGSLATSSNPHVHPQLLTFLIISILGLFIPLAIPLAGEVRAMLWLIPLYCICSVILIGRSLLSPPPMRWLGAAAFAVLIGSELFADHWISTVPSQPIRDTFNITNKLVAQGHPVIGVYMGTHEGGMLYAFDVPMLYAYQLNSNPEATTEFLPSLKVAEAKAAQFHKPIYAIVFFDQFLRRDQPDLWNYLHQNYTPVNHLPGRLSPATIFVRNAPPTTQP